MFDLTDVTLQLAMQNYYNCYKKYGWVRNRCYARKSKTWLKFSDLRKKKMRLKYLLLINLVNSKLKSVCIKNWQHLSTHAIWTLILKLKIYIYISPLTFIWNSLNFCLHQIQLFSSLRRTNINPFYLTGQ